MDTETMVFWNEREEFGLYTPVLYSIIGYICFVQWLTLESIPGHDYKYVAYLGSVRSIETEIKLSYSLFNSKF